MVRPQNGTAVLKGLTPIDSTPPWMEQRSRARHDQAHAVALYVNGQRAYFGDVLYMPMVATNNGNIPHLGRITDSSSVTYIVQGRYIPELYDLYDLAHVSGWAPPKLAWSTVGHVSCVGSLQYRSYTASYNGRLDPSDLSDLSDLSVDDLTCPTCETLATMVTLYLEPGIYKVRTWYQVYNKRMVPVRSAGTPVLGASVFSRTAPAPPPPPPLRSIVPKLLSQSLQPFDSLVLAPGPTTTSPRAGVAVGLFC